MAALHHVGAGAPGNVTPSSDEAAKLGSGGGLWEQATVDSSDSAEKLIATAIAHAAFLGIECHSDGRGAWVLRHASGASIGRVSGRDALTAAVAGFEAARADVQALVMLMGRSQ